MKKRNLILLSIASSLLMSISAHAKAEKIGGYFDYDADNGWWWYKEKYTDGKKEFETKFKVTPKEKNKMDKEDEKLKILKEQNEKLSKIKERLEYAYPNITPIYTKNSKTGKKCKTNSSVDCYVFPLQAEAQHIPVMAKWLSNPSPENSKEWLKWQAKYFNHLTNIGYGNKFAYLNGGDKVYNTDDYYNVSDNIINGPITETVLNTRKLEIINSLKDKLTTLIFLGKTLALDFNTRTDKVFYFWNKEEYKKMNFYFVFEDKKSLAAYDKKIKESSSDENKKAWEKFKKEKLLIIKPSYFKKFNVKITPTTVALYTRDKKKDTKSKGKEVIWQTISNGNGSPMRVLRGTIQFLIYNKIIKPSELSNSKIIKSSQNNVNSKPKLNEDKIFKETNNFKIRGR